MSAIDQLVENNQQYAADFDQANLPVPPSRQVAVVTCMDARLDVYGLLGLDLGEAHVIRNAGGVVTEDAVRSLLISQKLLGTTEVAVIHHTDCGMLTFKDDEVRESVREDTGVRPPFALEAFPDPDDDVRQSLRRLAATPFVPNKEGLRGFVYEVETGALREVTWG
ncbi:MAG: carbonic anhydrase [Actinobacteria bacterium QS_8_72_14]|nr:MAG: carbonic anhydrase [Actinobacteria bacterium QS_8_72_14]